MRSSSHPDSRERAVDSAQTKKGERNHGRGRLLIVGIGPGDADHMTGRAQKALAEANTIAGYTTYVDLVRPFLKEKKIISTGMKKEVDRVRRAITEALGNGSPCAILASGDPGIYALAGLAFEVAGEMGVTVLRETESADASDHAPQLAIEVVPGVSALGAGAALLGAPLVHDFSVISLSDLLTPWETIEKRIEAAAKADFVTVFYNPKSRKRNWQLDHAISILRKHRSLNTPVGVVKAAMREDQTVHLSTLASFTTENVDMQSTVFVGNSQTFKMGHFMVTPRGYASKYKLGN